MRKLLFIAFLVLAFFQAQAQDGYFYQTYYQHNFDNIGNETNAILQDAQGIMYFGHRKGMLRYDGSHWRLIETPASVYGLGLDRKSNTVYIGGRHFVGYIDKKSTGDETFKEIKLSVETSYDFTEVVCVEDRVFFYGDGLVVEYDPVKKEVAALRKSEPEKELLSVFNIKNDVYFEVGNKGIHRYSGGALKPLNAFIPEYDRVLFAEPIPEIGKTFIGTLTGDFYLFDGKQFEKQEFEDSTYLETSQILDAKSLGDSKIALSGIRGGCLIADFTTGKTVEIINFQSGLPDDEVFAIGTDKSSGIWIAHAYGFSRVDHKLPFRNYSEYNNLSGYVLDIYSSNNEELYVATTNGVYMLSEIKNFEEIEKIVARTIYKNRSSKVFSKKDKPNAGSKKIKSLLSSFGKKNKDSKEKGNDSERSEEEAQEDNIVSKAKHKLDKIKKGIFKRKKDRKKKKKGKKGGDEASDDSTTEESDDSPPAPKSSDKKNTKPKKGKSKKRKTRTVYRTETILALESIKHAFKKVEGINGKCSFIKELNGRIIAGGTSGLYEINGETAQSISEDPIQHFCVSEHRDAIFATTLNNSLLTVTKEGNEWNIIQTTFAFKDRVDHIFEDKRNFIWIAGSDFIHRLELNGTNNITDIRSLEIENKYGDPVYPLYHQGELHFVVSSSAYKYIHKDMSLKEVPSLSAHFPQSAHLISRSEHYLWAKKDHGFWQLYGNSEDFNQNNLILLNIMDNIENIIPDKDNRFVWVVTADNRFFKFDISGKKNIGHEYSLLIDRIKNKNGELLPLSNLTLNFEDNSLNFSFITPEYLNSEALEYQYMLEGKMDDWSEWSRNGSVDFPHLPPSKYLLKIRSRNAFGHIEEHDVFRFTVPPPYWRTWWFYAIEIGFFGSMILLTAYLNRRATARAKYFVFIRKTLTILTLILTAEFVKVILLSNVDIEGSPVWDFGLEVGFALLIFPFERLLSYLINKTNKSEDNEVAHKGEAPG